MSDQLSSDLASLRIDRSVPRAGGGRRGGSGLLGKLMLAAVLLGGLGAAWRWGKPAVEGALFRSEVAVTEIVSVSPAQASVELTASGYVEARRVSKVAAKVPGKVTRVHVVQGSEVQAGDVLFELEVVDQRATVAAARSRVAAARARVAVARANLKEGEQAARRERTLAAQGISPTASADDLEARVESLRETVKASLAEVRAAQAEVAALEVGLGNYVVRAPLTGRVLNEPPQVGEYVGPQPAGISVDMGGVEIADFSTLVVEADVAEARLHQARLGSPCEIVLDAFPDRRYRGKAIEIVPRVNRAKATVTVRVSFVDAPRDVLPDMAARVSFLASELDAEAAKAPPKVVVPRAAVLERGGTTGVFVVEGDRVRLVSVKLGPAFGAGFELEHGPAPGTRVVKSPSPELADGQRIKERSDG